MLSGIPSSIPRNEVRSQVRSQVGLFKDAVILTERSTLLEMKRGELQRIEYADGLVIDHRCLQERAKAT